ncbi:MAG: glycosyltransferase [Acidobacteriota bacterium]
MSRLKVMFVLPSLHGGGAERAAVTLLQGMSPTHYDLTLYLFAREGAYLDQVPAHVRLEGAGGNRVARVLALARAIAAARTDVVVSFLSHFTVYAAVRASRSGARYVISQQTPLSSFLGDADYRWRQPARRLVFSTVARAVYARADLIAATSRGVADDLVANYRARRDRIVIVHNPVNVEEVERRADEPLGADLETGDVPTIVTAGRLAEAKNLPLLVDSLKALAHTTAFRAWILGQGELEADVRQRLADARLTDRVRLLGFQDNPWKFMTRADVFVLTSHYEGFGNVLVEAMACGLPVVATASSGTREIVEHETTGLLVEDHAPAQVAAALERLLADRAHRARLAAAARARARAFSVSAIAARFGHALDGVVMQGAS